MLPALKNEISAIIPAMKKMDDLFSKFFWQDFDLESEFFETEFYRSDVFKQKNGKLYVDVPGFNKNNLKVNFSEGFIEISGENDFGRKISKKIKLSRGLKEPISAEVKDGVLTLQFNTGISDAREITVN